MRIRIFSRIIKRILAFLEQSSRAIDICYRPMQKIDYYWESFHIIRRDS